MKPVIVSEPGDPTVPNEDWAAAAGDDIVVLDGATARIDTGCKHGVAWFVAKLGAEVTSGLAYKPTRTLTELLADSIRAVASMHIECDLSHPGTPSAGVAMVRVSEGSLEYLVLADTVVIVRGREENIVVTDDRVSRTASAERETATALPFDSEERKEALRRMKRREQAARNRHGGFWVAAADPEAASHAITGSVDLEKSTAVAALTDGAARCVVPFGLTTWEGAMQILDEYGPSELIHMVRQAEATDPEAERWQRTKVSDDATVVYSVLS